MSLHLALLRAGQLGLCSNILCLLLYLLLYFYFMGVKLLLNFCYMFQATTQTEIAQDRKVLFCPVQGTSIYSSEESKPLEVVVARAGSPVYFGLLGQRELQMAQRWQ